MSPKRKGPFGIFLLLSLAVALFCLVYPVYVIRPFRYQGPRELQLALTVLRIRPTVFGLAVGVALASAILWRRKLGIVVVVAVAGVSALGAINIYEKMFHPMPRPEFAPVSDTKLDGDEKVITVGVRGEARAYPIRSMSYHHVVNDVVAGVPIVATY